MATMQRNGLLEEMRDQVRRHPLRLAILALPVQGKSLDADDLRRELPTHPTTGVIEYHLSVLRRIELLPL